MTFCGQIEDGAPILKGEKWIILSFHLNHLEKRLVGMYFTRDFVLGDTFLLMVAQILFKTTRRA